MKNIKIFNTDTDKWETAKIVGYCAYCKDEIFLGEKYRKIKDKVYHDVCLEQKQN